MSAAQRKPWPMKWVVLAILACIIPYTWLTLHYRKTGKVFEPYEDMKNQANVTRLLAHGYQRVTVPAERLELAPVPPAGFAPSKPSAAGYPKLLAEALAEPPLLPLGYKSVATAAKSAAGQPVSVAFVCRLPDEHHVVGGLEIYAKEDRIYLVPSFESVGGLSTRSRDFSARAEIPARLLPAGTYQAALLGSESSLGWTLQVH